MRLLSLDSKMNSEKHTNRRKTIRVYKKRNAFWQFWAESANENMNIVSIISNAIFPLDVIF